MPIDSVIGGAIGAAGITTGLDPGAGGTAPAGGADGAFERILEAVNGAAAEANQATSNMLSGTGDVHDAMIALQQADLTLQFAVQIRNKLVQAYQEIARMPV